MRKLIFDLQGKETNEENVIYSICVDDVKSTYEGITGNKWKNLDLDQQEDIIHRAKKAMETTDWYETLKIGVQEALYELGAE